MPRFVERIILRKKKAVIALSSIIFPRKKIKKIQLHSRTDFRENGTDQDFRTSLLDFASKLYFRSILFDKGN